MTCPKLTEREKYSKVTEKYNKLNVREILISSSTWLDQNSPSHPMTKRHMSKQEHPNVELPKSKIAQKHER